MARKLEDVLRSRRDRKEASIRILHCQDDLDRVQDLLRVLEIACTSIDIPREFHANAVLTAFVSEELRDIELGLSEVQKLLR